MSTSSNHIAVIDYGMGNLHSVAKALEHVCPKAQVSVTSDASVVSRADRVVFPGVGAIRDCMSEIQRLKVGDVVREAAKEKPVLGICVGMQALLQHSEENKGVDCLGLLPGNVKFFGQNHKDTQGDRLKVPHMGWNNVNFNKPSPLTEDLDNDDYFYFVHSYYVPIANSSIGITDYSESFASIIQKDNFFGTQFHPEKSSDQGSKLLRTFINL